jgi:FkbM family methyltransferase
MSGSARLHSCPRSRRSARHEAFDPLVAKSRRQSEGVYSDRGHGIMTIVVKSLAIIGSWIGKPPGWERVVRWLAPPEKLTGIPDLQLVRDDISFIVQPSVLIGWHILFFGSYEAELRRLFRTILPRGGVAIDVGANVGWHATLMASRVGSTGRVLAIEPNPSVRKRLSDNLSLNQMNNVDVIPYVIADFDGVVDFLDLHADEIGSGSGHVVASADAEQCETIKVETRRLDHVIAGSNIHRIDLLKIDVEGYEWPALQGGAESIAKFRPHIVFEYDAAYAMRGGGSPITLLKFFNNLNYTLTSVGRRLRSMETDEGWPKCTNIWAKPL